MGLFRKITSASTLGAVDYRSDKERTAAYTKGAKKQAKKQTKIMRDQARAQEQHQRAMQAQTAASTPAPAPMPPAPVAAPAPVVQGPPPGWYTDQSDANVNRWFDGAQWTSSTQPRQQPPQ